MKRLRFLRFKGVYEYSSDRKLSEVLEFLVGCGIHNIEVVKSEVSVVEEFNKLSKEGRR